MARRHKRSHTERFVQIEHWVLNFPAWKALTPNARCIYVELKKLYNGSNNGYLALSSRDAGDALNSSHHTGARALKELVDAGFVAISEKSTFSRKLKLATEYRITELRNDRAGEASDPTKDFMKSKHSRTSETVSRMGDTVGRKL